MDVFLGVSRGSSLGTGWKWMSRHIVCWVVFARGVEYCDGVLLQFQHPSVESCVRVCSGICEDLFQRLAIRHD